MQEKTYRLFDDKCEAVLKNVRLSMRSALHVFMIVTGAEMLVALGLLLHWLNVPVKRIGVLLLSYALFQVVSFVILNKALSPDQ